MKVTEIIPEICYIGVVIKEVKYENKICKIEVRADLTTGRCLSAHCESPYFFMGQGFWDEEFGKKQANRIRKYCKQEVDKFLKDNKVVNERVNNS